MKFNRIIASFMSIAMFTTFLTVKAEDTNGDGEDSETCISCQLLDSPHHIDQQAVEYYQGLANEAERYNQEQALKNPFGAVHVYRNASVTSQAWANAGITRYYQTDYQDLLCPNSSSSWTIANSGCVVTSFAMIATKYGISADPLYVRTRLNQDAPGNESACNFPWFNSLRAQEITNANWSVAFDNIEGALLANRPVLAFLKQSSGNTHAVVVYGYEHYSDGGEYHYIFNPDPSVSSHQMSLEEFKRDGWMVDRLMVYYK